MYSAELIDRLCEVVRAQARIIKEQAFYIENCLNSDENTKEKFEKMRGSIEDEITILTRKPF